MNRNDDFTHVLEAWLRREAPSQAPDRVLDAALARVATESQRPAWLQRFVGETPMAAAVRVAALAAVIALAVLVSLQFRNLLPDVGPPPSPSEVSTPSPLPAGCVNPPADITELFDQEIDPAGDVVACYGNAPLTLDAQLSGLGVVDCPMSPEPAWLACSSYSLQLVGETRKVGAPFLQVAVDPASDVATRWEGGTNARVTGHYDDPAAQTCHETVLGGGAETLAPVAVTIEQCRRTFVITDVVPLEAFADPTGTITLIAEVGSGPGVSVSEAIADAPTERVLVNGWLLIDGFGNVWLCEALLESIPPRFGGARLRVEGYPDATSADFQEADGVRWLPDSIQLFGSVSVP
jgi:hypothetical protein